MVHRKRTHRVNQCRNLPSCNRGETCWWVHPESVTVERKEESRHVSTENASVTQNSEFICRVCNNEFNSKSELMRHRKIDHADRVRQCTDFASNFCRRGDQQCWYRHSMNKETNSQSVQSRQDFHQGQQTHKPPEMSSQKEIMKQMMTEMQTMLMNS